MDANAKEILVRRFWQANADSAFDTAAEMMLPTATVKWPLSNELIPTPGDWQAIKEHYPGTWNIDVRHVLVDGDTCITLSHLSDGTHEESPITLFHFENGAISDIVEYWPQPSNAPEWRAGMVDTAAVQWPTAWESVSKLGSANVNREQARQFWEHVGSARFGLAEAMFVPDAVIDWPVTRERLTTPREWARINEVYAGRWLAEVQSVYGNQPWVLAIVNVTDGASSYLCLSCFTFENGLIRRLVEYWPEPEAPAEWRRPWVRPLVA